MKTLRTYPLRLEKITGDYEVVYRQILLDRPGGYRFAIDTDGNFFHEPEKPVSGPFFDSVPVRTLPPEAMKLLREMLPEAKPETLPAIVHDGEFESFSHPFIEIWYIRATNKAGYHTVVVENGEAPKAFVFIRNLIDKLLSRTC